MKNLFFILFALMFCLGAQAQWGGETGVQPKPAGTNDYGTEYVIGTDGTIWFYYYHPSSIEVDDMYTATYELCLQAIDKDGHLLFGDKGKVVSSYDNRSYTVVNQTLYANSDGTVTMVASDCRNSSEKLKSYTAYRFRKDGTSVWDEDGINLDEAMQTDFCACMTFCELSDGSTAFAWQHDYGEGTAIEIQRVSKDGECMYNLADTRLAKTNGYYVYPYMVPSTDGGFILVYGYTSSYYLRAMKFNPNGTKAWASEAKIYGGGWGSIMSLQVRMKVYPAPDGGVIVTWNDDRNNEGYYAPYLAYIKADGTAAFVNENGKPDIRLSYEEYSAHPPVITLSRDKKYIYAITDQFSQGNQSFNQVCLQKLNMSGELLYGDYGEAICPIDERNFGSASVQLGKEGQIICYWQEFFDYHHINNVMSFRNEEDGSAVDEDNSEIIWRGTNYYRAGLESTYSPVDNTILLFWEEDPVGVGSGTKTQYEVFIKMNLDGTEVVTSTDVTKGDANGDGNVQMSDANLVVNAYTTGDNSKITNTDAADVTGDGEITMADANGIVNIFVTE